MESRYLDGPSRRSPISVLTGFFGSGKAGFGTARAQSKNPSSPDPRADTIRPGALA